MIVAALILLQAAATAGPPERAIALGRQVAETGTLGALLPMIEAKETDELVAAHPELSDADRAALRRVAHRVASAGKRRLFEAEAVAYARSISIADMEAVIAFNTGPSAQALRRAQPAAIGAAMQALAGLDFKRDAIAAFCAETGRGCVK